MKLILLRAALFCSPLSSFDRTLRRAPVPCAGCRAPHGSSGLSRTSLPLLSLRPGAGGGREAAKGTRGSCGSAKNQAGSTRPCKSITLAGRHSHRAGFCKRAATQLPLKYDFKVGPQRPWGSLSHPGPRDRGLFLTPSAAPSSSSVLHAGEVTHRLVYVFSFPGL